MDDIDYLRLWAPFKPYIGKIPNEVANSCFGIYEAAENLNDKAQFIYMCCSEVSKFGTIPKGFETKTLPKQLYAVFKHRGPLLNIQNTFKYVWGTWLPNSNYNYYPSLDFELYPENYNASSKQAVVELYIPVTKRITT